MGFHTNFDPTDLTYLCSGCLLIILSILCFSYSQIKIALCLLFLGAFTFRIWMCVIDPFIQIWDEQFHALVARNMMNNPFNPMLYRNPVLPYDFRNWTGNQIWIHKQPLFLWQMALSMKFFGVSPFAIRFPSAVLSSLLVPVVYRMGKIIFNVRTGYIAALFIAVSNVQINIVSGFLNTDHNDAVFLYYITFSIWAWIEYIHSGKKYWLFLIGLFSGMAILVKWLVGLLVYAGWIISLVTDKGKRERLSNWIDIGLSVVVTTIIALPWQLYMRSKWPLEYSEEVSQNFRHLSENFGHPGPWWYHFSILEDTYGVSVMLLLITGIFLFLFSGVPKYFKWAITFNILLVYAFFSFVPIRMPFFCLIVSPMIILIVAQALEKFFQWVNRITIKYANLIITLVLCVISFNILDYDRLEFFHKDRDKIDYFRQARLNNQRVFTETKKLLRDEDYVVFNCPKWNSVAFMFYTGMTAYDILPTQLQYMELKSKKIRMAVFNDIAIPEYLLNDSSIIKLPYKLIRNGF